VVGLGELHRPGDLVGDGLGVSQRGDPLEDGLQGPPLRGTATRIVLIVEG
jgi:hypothetical protein